MNPPSALHGAMSRDRKPFTYTPGGLDLSEIKSQRMAQRLMRNAMNPGVPEIAVNTALPSSNPTAHVAHPNFNCLPVQVFPAMPFNPKTLLRSRSNPDPRQAPEQRLNTPIFVNKAKTDNKYIAHENNSRSSQQLNFSQPASVYEYSTQQDNAFKSSKPNYESDGGRISLANAPVPSFVYTPVTAPISAYQSGLDVTPVPTFASVLPEISYEAEFCIAPKNYNGQSCLSLMDDKIAAHSTENREILNIKQTEDAPLNPKLDNTLNIIEEDNVTATNLPAKNVEEDKNIDDEQREVKVVKKQVTKENKVEEQNGKENGNTNKETEMTIKLPTKKSAAKTETKVEVEKKVLPDGSTEEVKTTTTTTTIDGRTEIKTKTETKIIPKAVEYEEEVEEEEEEEVEEETTEDFKEINEEATEEPETITVTKGLAETKQNGNLVTNEKSEITTVKKVVVIQEPEETEEVEEEEVETEETEVEETEPVTVILKKQTTPEKEIESTTEEVKEEEKIIEDTELLREETSSNEDKQIEDKEEEIEETELEEEVEADVEEEPKSKVLQDEQEGEEEEEEEYEEAEEEKQKDSVHEIVEEAKSEQKFEEKESVQSKEESMGGEKENTIPKKSDDQPEKEEHVIPVQICSTKESPPKPKEEVPIEKPCEYTIPIREPSIPLEKVEDVEIKPIGISPITKKTRTEDTEIITNKIDPSGGISRQTDYNKFENIVTINRTTKILDQNYETITQQGIPIVKTYFPPPSIDRISTSPMPSRPYQSEYAPEPTTERRHSLLLERLSMERQIPSDIYQHSNQLHDQVSYQDEPQSEILTVSNVKPSSITNQQWYQQTKQTQNVLYNNVTSTPTPVGTPWAQPKSPQPQQQYQPQPQYQPQLQPQYQTPTQPQFQRGTTPQPQFQRGTTPQPQYQRGVTPLPQFQKTPQPQYQPTYAEPPQDRMPTKNYSTFAPTQTWLESNIDTKQNQYSYVNKDSTQTYQNSKTNSCSQQYSSDYVPPPWEQDSSYTSVNNTSEKYYREIPQTNTFSSTKPSQSWTAPPTSAKFTKPSPIAYVPPAPNQSFVKTASYVEPPRTIPGRKTYYSEYERRYITVPESTYIPTETKFQPQPDPSPQYYYDNNEPTESVEPQWRRELREFTEKTSQTIEETNVPPPWEVDSKYAKTPSSTYTPTPTWSQTLRPQSYRKRSFESEFLSQEWPKTNTLGRGRPLSTMGKSLDGAVPERARGMSVDRYNPNNYQPPAEHPPVQSHTLTTSLPHASYHNPNVPAYHARASAEPREQPVNYQQRVYREARASPLQSRSFKYLQWITGTEN